MTIAILALAALSLAAEPPVLPRPVIAPELRATDCADAGQRKRLSDQGGAAMTAAEPILRQANDAMQARMQAHGDALVARGVWAEADRARFARQLFADPAFVDHAGKAMAAAEPMLQQANDAMEARMQAHGDRLVARGVWTEADRARFARQLFADPAFVDHAGKAMAVVVTMMESLETLAAAEQDEARRCRAMLGLLGQVDQGLAVGDAGWRLIDRLYAVEARRLGVTLD